MAGIWDSETISVVAKELKVNGYVLIDGIPCKILDANASKIGKYGSAQIVFSAKGIFNGKHYTSTAAPRDGMFVPVVRQHEFTLINIIDGFLILKTADEKTKDDIQVPEEELGEKLTADFNRGKELIVEVISCMGEQACISYKKAPKN